MRHFRDLENVKLRAEIFLHSSTEPLYIEDMRSITKTKYGKSELRKLKITPIIGTTEERSRLLFFFLSTTFKLIANIFYYFLIFHLHFQGCKKSNETTSYQTTNYDHFTGPVG